MLPADLVLTVSSNNETKNEDDFFAQVKDIEWARFTTDGYLVDCSQSLMGNWRLNGVKPGVARAGDCFDFRGRESEYFYNAWISALKMRSSRVELRLKGSQTLKCRCFFTPETDKRGNLKNVFIEIEKIEAPILDVVGDREQFLTAALRATSEAMVIADDLGKLIWANNAFCRLVVASEEEVLGNNIFDVFDPEITARARTRLLGNFKRFRDFVEETRLSCGGRSNNRVRVQANPMGRNDSGASLFVLKCSEISGLENEFGESIEKIDKARRYFRDTIGHNTEFEAVLDTIREEVEQMRQQSESKTAFLANISHEIRTPMNAVIGFCDLLLSTKLSDEQNECVEAIYHSGQLLIQLIGQVLDFSKIDSGHLELVEDEIDLKLVLLEAQAIMGARVRSKDMAFDVDCEKVSGELVVGDPIRIKQIVVNLLGNAFKFTRSGRIGIIARTLASDLADHLRLRVRVEDSGIGIDPKAVKTLFDPFAQANNEISRSFGGTGLGLAICKRLCQVMKGDIWIESTSSEGSVFCFEIDLPLAASFASSEDSIAEPASDSLEEREVEESENEAERPLRVLVVDDNPNNLLITSKLSEHLGFEVRTVRSGIEAIEALEKDDFDIVLMDVRMAPIDGLETTKRIRKGAAGDKTKDIYIIAVTAHALQGDRERCVASGMNDYLSKPLTLDRLGDSLDRAKDTIQP